MGKLKTYFLHCQQYITFLVQDPVRCRQCVGNELRDQNHHEILVWNLLRWLLDLKRKRQAIYCCHEKGLQENVVQGI